MSDRDDTVTLRTIVIGVGASVVLIAIGIWLYSTGKLGYIGLNPAGAIWIAFFVIFLVLAALGFGVFLLKNSNQIRTVEGSPSVLPPIDSRTLRQTIIGAGLLISITFFWAGTFVLVKTEQSEIVLPIVIIAGLAILLVVLGLLTYCFSILKLTDPDQPLALPEGSVRAVIALMLLLVFAIAAIFLYSNVSNGGKLHEFNDVTKGQLAALQKQGGVVHFEPKNPAASPADGPFTVYYRDINSQAGDDLAKQLIVLLGTLVTAVASFYFGSSSVASARDAAERARVGAGGPNASSVGPTSLKANGTSQPLTVTGTNLGNVNAVKLVSEDRKVSIPADAGSVKSSATNVTCNVTVPADTPVGVYDVVVSDNANNDSTVPKGMSVQSAVITPTTVPTPKVTGISPNPAPRDGNLKQFTVTGTGLGKTNKVTFVTAGEPDISASKVTPQGEDKVVCDFTIPPATKLGKWDVVVSDGATSAKLSEGLQIT